MLGLKLLIVSAILVITINTMSQGLSKQIKKKVFVGISGGVDSSVSAALLKEQGYDVTGVFIKVWQPPFLECSIKDDRRDAMRVCAQLNIPFLECDGEEAYKTKVIDYMMDEYTKGRTPNPDVMCNKYVKFGIFYDWAMKQGADYVATGHYAQVERNNDTAKLIKSVSEAKDQSYFLWAIGSDKLSRVIFPIGNIEKEEVRKQAQRFNLFTAEKKDSQGLCFLGKLDVKDFLKKFIPGKKGNVLNEKGEIIGEHEGAFFFTLGERHGFIVAKKSPEDKPMYVIEKDIDNNTITVSSTCAVVEGLHAYAIKDVVIYDTEKMFDHSVIKKAVYRYHGEEIDIKNIEKMEDGLKIELIEGKNDISLGQSLVIYAGNELIGGGIIEML
jgi:tRNA-uridine 2-sulfurtransferase